MILLLMVSLFIACLFILSLTKSQRANKARHWLLLSWISGICLVVLGFSAWKTADFYSPRHKVEIGIPINSRFTQSEYRVFFRVPAGPYQVVATLEGEPQNQDDVGKIRYHLKIPQQGIDITREETITWGLKVSQNRLKSFEIKEHASEGTLSVEVLKPTQKNFRVEFISARQLDM